MLCEEWKWFCRILYVLVREIEKKLLGNGLEAVWKRFGNGFSSFSKSLDWVGFMIRECDELVYDDDIHVRVIAFPNAVPIQPQPQLQPQPLQKMKQKKKLHKLYILIF